MPVIPVAVASGALAGRLVPPSIHISPRRSSSVVGRRQRARRASEAPRRPEPTAGWGNRFAPPCLSEERPASGWFGFAAAAFRVRTPRPLPAAEPPRCAYYLYSPPPPPPTSPLRARVPPWRAAPRHPPPRRARRGARSRLLRGGAPADAAAQPVAVLDQRVLVEFVLEAEHLVHAPPPVGCRRLGQPARAPPLLDPDRLSPARAARSAPRRAVVQRRGGGARGAYAWRMRRHAPSSAGSTASARWSLAARRAMGRAAGSRGGERSPGSPSMRRRTSSGPGSGS